ncbi:uncharacterized protein LOC128164761 isoform X2 [Crassostrea angulata]|uniref:uncharacterized protein LOC128164761 isoform X2 n=1 Tax=Magallana angulata TaxID=2784310 RepID=UPI0022B1BD01|nr:uncharacterized protein LOC128164761 isoform X2 [Crassostrea angulata]
MNVQHLMFKMSSKASSFLIAITLLANLITVNMTETNEVEIQTRLGNIIGLQQMKLPKRKSALLQEEASSPSNNYK